MSARDVIADTLGDKDAGTIISNLEVAGFVIVPNHPTDKMIDEGWESGGWWEDTHPQAVYEAMIASARL